jgi:antitoxin (DNA-binding transcriptional repressor) of toxin-antitoxin stability system
MQVSATEAATKLNELMEAAINGEEVILFNGDRPAIKFTPIESVKPRPKFGSAKGLVDRGANRATIMSGIGSREYEMVA